jgi:hypothetical protein
MEEEKRKAVRRRNRRDLTTPIGRSRGMRLSKTEPQNVSEGTAKQEQTRGAGDLPRKLHWAMVQVFLALGGGA